MMIESAVNLLRVEEGQIRRRRRREALLDVGLVSGLALVTLGLWQIYRPLGPIAAGLFLATICWLAGYVRPQKENE